MGKTAGKFSTSKRYVAGDYVLYGGDLFRFTVTHNAGAWNSSQVEAVDNHTEADIERIIAGYNAAEKAADFVDTLVFEPVQITGSRYRYIISSAPDPR